MLNFCQISKYNPRKVSMCLCLCLYGQLKQLSQDGQYVGQQQEDQGYQSSLSSPNESQMKRTGWVIRRISLVDFCLLGGLSDESLQLTFVWCQITFPICPLRPGPASQKQLLTVQKATSDPFSQSLPESLLGIFYYTTASLIKPEHIL